MIGNIFQNFYLGKKNNNYNYYVSKLKLVYSQHIGKHIIVFGSCYSACDDFLEYCIEKNPELRPQWIFNNTCICGIRGCQNCNINIGSYFPYHGLDLIKSQDINSEIEFKPILLTGRIIKIQRKVREKIKNKKIRNFLLLDLCLKRLAIQIPSEINKQIYDYLYS